MADDVERTALGIVMALERDDHRALPALFFLDDGSPVDDLELIVTLGRLCVHLAGLAAVNAGPPLTAADVLAKLALDWGAPG
jgi:hypothetical protein